MSAESNRKLLSMHFQVEVRNGIDDLRAYTKKIEEYLESQKSKIEDKNSKEFRKIAVNEESENIFHNISLRLGYERHIEIFTKSAIISIYAFLEFSLDDFCNKIHQFDKRLVSPKDLSGSGIFRSKLYLSKVLSIAFENVNNQWESIVKLNEIRNFLVHSNGVAAGSESKLKIQKTIKEISGVQLDRDHIKISAGYISSILSIIEYFLTEVQVQYSKVI